MRKKFKVWWCMVAHMPHHTAPKGYTAEPMVWYCNICDRTWEGPI